MICEKERFSIQIQITLLYCAAEPPRPHGPASAACVAVVARTRVVGDGALAAPARGGLDALDAPAHPVITNATAVAPTTARMGPTVRGQARRHGRQHSEQALWPGRPVRDALPRLLEHR